MASNLRTEWNPAEHLQLKQVQLSQEEPVRTGSEHARTHTPRTVTSHFGAPYFTAQPSNITALKLKALENDKSDTNF